ncbi:MAG TPA: GPW/gp25 family protein [Anaerolineales bacterium]|nr:GPW/gp25 family protein [Anaerolineales bacterium]
MSELIGRGWSFPVKPGSNGRLLFLDGPEKVRQGIWILLSTAPGERQMLPDYGCGIHDLVFQANTSTLRGLVEANVRDALIRWEPRIDVIEVRVETPPEARNYLLIRIDYRLRSNNSFYNLVYPYFINEGVGLESSAG